MKSQDIFILLKLVCLEQQELRVKQSPETGKSASVEDFQDDALFELEVERPAGQEASNREYGEKWDKLHNDEVLNNEEAPHGEYEEKWDKLDNDKEDIKQQEGKWEGWNRDKVDLEQELLIDLASAPSFLNHYSVRSLSALLGVSKTEISSSIKRSIISEIACLDHEKSPRVKVNKKILFNFIIHGIRYVFPAAISIMTRGIPTSFASPVLREHVETAGDLIYVWPDPQGKEMGQSVAPLYPSVPFAVRRDRQLYEYLSLVDAIRLGSAREVNLAKILLEKRLIHS